MQAEVPPKSMGEQAGVFAARTVKRCGPEKSTPPSTSAALTWPWYLQCNVRAYFSISCSGLERREAGAMARCGGSKRGTERAST